MTEWIGIITLIVAIATLIVAFATYIISRRSLDVAKRSMKNAQESERHRLLNEIASKEAQLKSMRDIMRNMANDVTMTQEAMLKAEIEQLKQQLKNDRVERI